MENKKYKVCVDCVTYNHVNYIEEAFDGFCNQMTSFPYLCTIVDDNSIDGEVDVIRRYIFEHFDIRDESILHLKETDDYSIMYAQHKKNPNCFFAVFFLKYNHYQAKKSKMNYFALMEENSEYVAICEGDDCWIHPEKLQIQVDFLESHPDYVMCHTDFSLANGGYRNHYVYVAPEDNFFPYSVHHELQIGTLTAMVRSDTLNEIPRLDKGKGWPMGDTPLWIEVSHEGKIKYLPIDTARYRVLTDSASHGSIEKEIKFIEAAREIHQFYANHYGIKLENDGHTKGYYISIMKSAYKHRCTEVANVYFKQAKKKKSLSPKLILFYIATRFKPARIILNKLYMS